MERDQSWIKAHKNKMSSAFQYHQIPPFDRDNYTKFREAIRAKNKDLVQHLVDGGINVNGIGEDFLNLTPLHLAVLSRNSEIMKLLLDEGANTGIRCNRGDTPLTLAARMENTMLVDLLLSYNVHNVENPHSNLSHLHIACMRNNLKVVKKLILMDNGKKINKAVKKDSLCWASYTALHFAAQYGCIETVKFLLKCGADILAKDERCLTPLHVADLHRNEEIIDLILTAHKDFYINPRNANALSHFHIACTRNDELIVRHFLHLDDGGSNQETKDGWIGMDFAIYYECPNVVRLLLKAGIYLEGSCLSNLPRYAHRLGNRTVHSLLIKERLRADEQFEDFRRFTCLFRACNYDDIEFLHSWERLIMRGVIDGPFDLHAPLWNGSTLLNFAIKHKSERVIDFLLNLETDVMLKDAEGKTPLHMAFDREFSNVIDKLTAKLDTCNSNIADDQGMTYFHIICTTNKLDLVEKFLSNDVDVNAQVGNESACWAGFTPLHIAVRFHKPKTVDFLLRSGADITITNALALNPFDLLVNELDVQDQYENRPSTDFSLISDILLVILSSHNQSVRVKEFDSKGFSLLHALCITEDQDDTKLCQYLTKHQNQINQIIDWPQSRRYHKCTPLHLTMRKGHYSKSKLLVAHGADLFKVNGVGQTPIECAIQFGYSPWKVAGYEECQTFFNLRSPIDKTRPSHFHFACVIGLMDRVRDSLNHADERLKMSYLNCRNDAGQTPLHSLLLEVTGKSPGKQQIVRMLLNSGADVNSKDCLLQTPLHYAQDADDPEFTNLLISHGADVNAQNLYGQTALHRCTFKSPQSFVEERMRLLLEGGTDINIEDERGNNCFMIYRELYKDHHDFQKVALIMVKHVKKLQLVGSFLSAMNESMYGDQLANVSEIFNEAAFVDECVKEIQMMKSININSHTTLHDILSENSNAMSSYCKNTQLLGIVDSNDFSQKYPIYGPMIELQMKKGKIRCFLSKKFLEFLNAVFKKPFPHTCLDIILQYLSDADLKNIASTLE